MYWAGGLRRDVPAFSAPPSIHRTFRADFFVSAALLALGRCLRDRGVGRGARRHRPARADEARASPGILSRVCAARGPRRSPRRRNQRARDSAGEFRQRPARDGRAAADPRLSYRRPWDLEKLQGLVSQEDKDSSEGFALGVGKDGYVGFYLGDGVSPDEALVHRTKPGVLARVQRHALRPHARHFARRLGHERPRG